ncbi:MAG: hypothetical protein HUJ26_03510 [Planctomycetaceae bacterium]|nr:hypothetical protein [Planctomycetaceae bacterium]
MMQKFYHTIWMVGIIAHSILVFETWKYIDLYASKGADGESNVPISYYFDLTLAVVSLLTFLLLKHWVSATAKKVPDRNQTTE